MNRTDHLRLPTAPSRGRPPTAWLPGLALVLISLMPGPGGAQVNGLTIPAGIMAPAAPFRPKDFALAKYNGQYHLLYINHDNTPNVVTETNLGHAVSPDLRHWTPLPPVLAAHSLTNADYDHIWAPSIIKKGSTYIMYFTAFRPYDSRFPRTSRTGRYSRPGSITNVEWCPGRCATRRS